MKKYQLVIIVLNLLLILGLYHYFVMAKEKTLAKGTLVLLELAPVDPRSLMQGDYMSLRYAITENVSDSIARTGYYVISLDSGLIARKLRIQPAPQPLNAGEMLLKYHQTSWQLALGAEDYFFQEGQAEKYDKAKYGGLRVDEKGNSILVGLYNEEKKLIQ